MSNNTSGFWSSETLQKRVPELIRPFQAGRVKHAAYELALGGEAFVTGEKSRQIIPDGGEVVIPPGQFAVLITEEDISVPANAIAFISMKSENKFRGLINVSGFHVDPGWSGKLMFSAFNAGVQELHLSKGEPLFLIWFASLDVETADLYAGKHKGQKRIPDAIITNIAVKHPSPSALQKDIEEAKQTFQKEINEVRKDVAHWRSVTWLLLALAAAATAGNFLTNFLKPAAPTPGPTQIIMPYPVLPSTPAPNLSPTSTPTPSPQPSASNPTQKP
jgi:dCTP deaminase